MPKLVPVVDPNVATIARPASDLRLVKRADGISQACMTLEIALRHDCFFRPTRTIQPVAMIRSDS